MKPVCVLLNGCGHCDGSEIQEAVFTLTALEEQGLEFYCVAPDDEQSKVIDHISGEEQPHEKRSMLRESARIARGKVESLATVSCKEFCALVIPGGFGSAMNLCNYASLGAEMAVRPDVAKLISAFHQAKKPIGAI